MKGKNSILLTLVATLACSERPVPVPFPVSVSASVSFGGKSVMEVKEIDAELIKIPIKLNSSQEYPLMISYDVIGEEVINGSDFEVTSANPMTIPSGSVSESISIQINDNNAVQPEVRKIFVRFRSVSPSKVEIKNPNEVVITIKDDDCFITSPMTSIWVGPLTIQDEFGIEKATGSVDIDDLCKGIVKVETNLFGEQVLFSVLTIQLLQDSLGSHKGTARVARFKVINGGSPLGYEAIGSYDEETKKITLNYLLLDFDNSIEFPGTQIIKAN